MKTLLSLVFGGSLVLGSLWVGYKCDTANPRPVKGTVKARYIKNFGSARRPAERYVVELETPTGIEVVQVRDCWWNLDFGSADRYAQCSEGKEIEGTVAGYRIPFLSAFPRLAKVN